MRLQGRWRVDRALGWGLEESPIVNDKRPSSVSPVSDSLKQVNTELFYICEIDYLLLLVRLQEYSLLGLKCESLQLI